MVSIGAFGKVVKQAEEKANEAVEYDSFEWFEETIRLQSWANPLPMSRFAQILDSDRMRVNLPATSAIYSVLEANILPEDWRKFEILCGINNAELDLLEELTEHLYVRWTNLPTQRAAVFSTGEQLVEPEDESSEPSSLVSVDLPQQDYSETPTPEPVTATNG